MLFVAFLTIIYPNVIKILLPMIEFESDINFSIFKS